jgi:hypothetical protein
LFSATGKEPSSGPTEASAHFRLAVVDHQD